MVGSTIDLGKDPTVNFHALNWVHTVGNLKQHSSVVEHDKRQRIIESHMGPLGYNEKEYSIKCDKLLSTVV